MGCGSWVSTPNNCSVTSSLCIKKNSQYPDAHSVLLEVANSLKRMNDKSFTHDDVKGDKAWERLRTVGVTRLTREVHTHWVCQWDILLAELVGRWPPVWLVAGSVLGDGDIFPSLD